jgi:hypothetical protein
MDCAVLELSPLAELSSWLMELDEEEDEPNDWLSCCSRLAPCELGESLASWESSVLTTELSPASKA